MTENEDKDHSLSEKFNLLNKKLDDLCYATSKNIETWSKEQIRISQAVTGWERKFQNSQFYQGIMIGFLLGILGNLFTSYFMEAIKPLVSTPAWVMSAITLFIMIAVIMTILYRQSKRALSS